MGLKRTYFKSAPCLVISQVFTKVYLSIYRVYLDSVTIASYYTLLIGLCHIAVKKSCNKFRSMVLPLSYWLSRRYANCFYFRGPYVFFIIYSKCFTFFIIYINIHSHFTFLYKLTNKLTM